MNDAEIVELFLVRDETALEHTAARYGARLRSLAFDIVADMQTAQECENDTYQQAWNAIPPHEPRTYLYAFLARITRHVSLSRCRERTRLKRHAYLCELSREMEECLPSPDDTACRLEEQELLRILNAFLEKLPAQKRILFVRRYWYLDSVASLAVRYGMSESNVKTTLFRVREQLRHHLEAEGYQP